MRGLLQLLSLPPALLSLIAVYAPIPLVAAEPYNLPAHVKYHPEDEALVKRGLSVMQELATRAPVGVRKMTEDEDEMFFLDYWQFEEPWEEEAYSVWRRSAGTESGNQTLDGSLLPPLLLHSTSPAQKYLKEKMNLFPRANLFKRDFQCPTGTNNCESIQRPNSCCATGETCISVVNTGLGDVGCCPQGDTCSDTISVCDASSGYNSCPGTGNGGCCIPGFSCFGIGCIVNTTSTTTTTLPAVTVTTCPGSYSSCPASLGGQCCPSGAACGSSKSCLVSSSPTTSSPTTTTTPSTTSSPTTTVAPAPPARPTGITDSGDATTPRTTIISSQTVAVCPSNFYFCSAYYRPGCCRIGRDCATSNCPAAASSSTIISNGVTVVVPVGPLTGGDSYVTTALITSTGDVAPVTTLRNGACQAGWASCDADVGRGCCPPNFGCGTICSATGGGATGFVSKVEPNGAAGGDLGMKYWICMMMVSVASSITMVVL